MVVNYESAWRIQDVLEEFGVELIIADEGHKIKEARTAQAKCLIWETEPSISCSLQEH